MKLHRRIGCVSGIYTLVFLLVGMASLILHIVYFFNKTWTIVYTIYTLIFSVTHDHGDDWTTIVYEKEWLNNTVINASKDLKLYLYNLNWTKLSFQSAISCIFVCPNLHVWRNNSDQCINLQILCLYNLLCCSYLGRQLWILSQTALLARKTLGERPTPNISPFAFHPSVTGTWPFEFCVFPQYNRIALSSDVLWYNTPAIHIREYHVWNRYF